MKQALGVTEVQLSHEEIRRYSRHLIMPEIGISGQSKLKQASVLLVGAGGLGSPLALYLAAAGVGHIGIVDFDVVDESNLQRQIIHATSALGKKKIVSAKMRLLDLNPAIEVSVYDEMFSSANAKAIAQDYDVIADGTDNFSTRYMVNDVCVLLGKPNVYGSIFRFSGQASVFAMKEGPCYRCLYATPPPVGLIPSCAEGGVLGVLPGIIGTIQATEVLKIILGQGQLLIGQLLLYDALNMDFTKLNVRKDPHCAICSEHATITELLDYDLFCGILSEKISTHAILEISPQELKTALDLPDQNLVVIDVREPHEWDIAHLDVAQLIPRADLPAHYNLLDPNIEYVLYCRSGMRSLEAAKLMKAVGFQVRSLSGGMNRWAEDIDPRMPMY